MKLIFVGPQGCGKGTQAKIVSEKFGICHISTGDLLRKVSSKDDPAGPDGDLKEEVDAIMAEGKLVPSDLMMRMIKERISKEDCKDGFILDGSPRNLYQAEELDKITDIDKVVEISISDEESIRRISGRRNCGGCGIIWNVNSSPKPAVENKCDSCGAELIQRADDNSESLKKRLKLYHAETEPVLEHYDSVKINGEQSIEEVSKEIMGALGLEE